MWRELRERFLERHRTDTAWAIDLGSGPGRFTPWIGGGGGRRIALDLSREMLRELARRWSTRGGSGPVPDRVRGDAADSPFPPSAFGTVAALGNAIGFAEKSSERVLEEAMRLVAPGGKLVLELAPASGERSRYLMRLPAPSVGRLLRAPVAAVLPRIEREGFEPVPPRRSVEGGFRRMAPDRLVKRLGREGWRVEETMAVAPAIGGDPERVEAAAHDPKSWGHLLRIEEELGRRPARRPRAAAVLIAAAKDDATDGDASKDGLESPPTLSASNNMP